MQLGKSGPAYQQLLCYNVEKELRFLQLTAGSQKVNTGFLGRYKSTWPNSAPRKTGRTDTGLR